jgi:hypothetical protein
MASKKSFSVGDAISFGWNTFKKDPMTIVYVLIPMLVPPVLNQILTMFVGKNPHWIILLLLIVINVAVSLTISIGLIRVLLTVAAGKKVDISDFYTGYTLAIPYFLASLLTGVIILGVGLAAVLVGAILYFILNAVIHDVGTMQIATVIGIVIVVAVAAFVSVKLSMWKYLLIDKKMGVVESVRESWKITQGKEASLVLFAIASVGIVLVGILALILGVFVALPVVQLGYIYIYKKLSPGK